MLYKKKSILLFHSITFLLLVISIFTTILSNALRHLYHLNNTPVHPPAASLRTLRKGFNTCLPMFYSSKWAGTIMYLRFAWNSIHQTGIPTINIIYNVSMLISHIRQTLATGRLTYDYDKNKFNIACSSTCHTYIRTTEASAIRFDQHQAVWVKWSRGSCFEKQLKVEGNAGIGIHNIQ